MAILQDRLNEISPYHVTDNPTGSTKVFGMPERKPTNDGQKENYRIVWSNDGGETRHPQIIRLVAKDGNWDFEDYPLCCNNAYRTVEEILEGKVAEWWTANQTSLGYATRGKSHISNLEQRLGQVSCTKVITGPLIEVHTWHFLKTPTEWTIAQGETRKLYDEVA